MSKPGRAVIIVSPAEQQTPDSRQLVYGTFFDTFTNIINGEPDQPISSLQDAVDTNNLAVRGVIEASGLPQDEVNRLVEVAMHHACLNHQVMNVSQESPL